MDIFIVDIFFFYNKVIYLCCNKDIFNWIEDIFIKLIEYLKNTSNELKISLI